jgi:hypothetical protein
MNSRQRAVRELQRHKYLKRERTGQSACPLTREAKSRIVMLVPEQADDAFAAVVEASQTPSTSVTKGVHECGRGTPQMPADGMVSINRKECSTYEHEN